MAHFKKLEGLPGTGPLAEQFSITGLGMHSEGFVVEFYPDNLPKWVGNFQRGLGKFDYVGPHIEPQKVVVVAGDDIYLVDVNTRKIDHQLGATIEEVISAENRIVFNGRTVIIVLDSNGIRTTRRLAWDGIRNLQINGSFAFGEGSAGDHWIPFEVDLDSLNVKGGVFFERVSPKPFWLEWLNRLFGKRDVKG